jgi:two-component system response regulator NreC
MQTIAMGDLSKASSITNTPASATLRVFVVDDHAVVRDGLMSLIDGYPDMEIVGAAADGRKAWKRIAELQPDIVIMDVSMPEWNGVEATTHIKQDWPDIKVLALSMHEDKSYLRSLLEAGASGYVLKRSAVSELIRAIRTVATGGTYLDPALAAVVVDNFMRDALRGEIQGLPLSERECEVLRCIAQGYTNKEIAVKLAVSIKTVETYKARAMEKQDLQSRVDIVHYALEQGWLNRTEK